MKIYVASSWRNPVQPEIVELLRDEGLEVYDFRHPHPGDDGFHWTEIDGGWKSWDAERFREALRHPVSDRGFNNDFEAMKSADACVLVMPCGRSAHLEAGYFVGAGKPLIILLANGEPELMYKMADHICVSYEELLAALAISVPRTIAAKTSA